MKNVVLIGDSIRLGYENKVRKILGDEINIISPNENGGWTKNTLWHVPFWMEQWGNPQVDLIHWNTGIWDMHRHISDGELFTPLYDYLNDSRRLAMQLASYTDRLVWATITPGGKGLNKGMPIDPLINTPADMKKNGLSVYENLTTYEKEWNYDVCRYNEAVSEMFRTQSIRSQKTGSYIGVRINDLYSAVAGDTDRYISEDGIHPTEEGYDVLAEAVALKIKSCL